MLIVYKLVYKSVELPVVHVLNLYSSQFNKTLLRNQIPQLVQVWFSLCSLFNAFILDPNPSISGSALLKYKIILITYK